MKPIVDTILNMPMLEWPIKHPSMPRDTRAEFYGCDSENLLSHNKKILPKNWVYNTTPVKYNFNKQGLRMRKNIENISADYIYFGGSSYTLGVGINEDARFSEKTSSSLNLDFINFSGPIYGIKMQTIAFFNFLNIGIHLPKVLIVEHLPGAYNYYSADNFLLYKSKYAANPEKYSSFYNAHKSLNETDHFFQESVMYANFLKSVCKRLKIKLIEISFYHNDRYTKEFNIVAVDRDSNKENINYCYGRDVYIENGHYTGHAGIGIHNEMTNLLLDQI